MNRVGFIVIGAMKCGTTTISRLLNNHTSVMIYPGKEPDFFSKNPNWRSEIDSYHSRLNLDHKGIIGEASTSYTSYPYYNLDTADSIYEYNPEMKIIYTVRDPVERAISHYMHFYSRRYTKLDLESALTKIPEIIDRGRYYYQLKPYLDRFNRDQIKLLVLEDYSEDMNGLRADLADFLQIEKEGFRGDEEVHSNPSVGNLRRSHKIDFAYKFIYENKLGKSLRNLVPGSLRKKGNQVMQNLFAKGFADKPNVKLETKKMIARASELDVYKIEELIGRKMDKWNTFYDSL